MKPPSSHPISPAFSFAALGFLLLTSCVTSVNLIEVVRGEAERRRGPKPEAVWNRDNLWERVADNPSTYIPTGYGAATPRTENEGTWFTDERDGKRLFAPKVEVGGLEPGVLMGEARKVTSWTRRDYTSTSPGILTDGGTMEFGEFLDTLPQSR